MVFDSDGTHFLGSEPGSDGADAQTNSLLKYLQHQSPEVLSRIARSVTSEAKQIISHNVQGLVGMLPSENFSVQITTDRENLASLLASAMMTGYFLRQMEQRMELEGTLTGSLPLRRDSATGETPDNSRWTDRDSDGSSVNPFDF